MHQGNLPWPGCCLTPLDAVETPVEHKTSSLVAGTLPPPSPLSDNFRHSGWKADRERIYDAMITIPVPYGRRDAFARCGSSHWILRHATDLDLFRIVPDHCHDRFCVPCGVQRQAVIRRNLATRLRDGPHRFLTLTVRSHSETLDQLVKHLYASFRRLRSRAFWKRHVTGGAAFLEVTFNEDRESWHPHLHVMLEGRYLDLQDLKQAWLGVTGDSHALSIRLIRQKPQVVSYITKYATKPLPASVVRRPPALEEALQTLAGTRMVLAFGSWRSWKLLDDPADADWTLFEHLAAVRYKAAEGNTLCQAILGMLCTADPNTGEFTAIDDGPPPDD